MADVEKVALAIWETREASLPAFLRNDLSWEKLRELSDRYPDMGRAKDVRLTMMEAKAALAAMGEREAVNAERERCARVADAECLVAEDASAREAARSIAANIRGGA